MGPVVKAGEVGRELRRFEARFGSMPQEERVRWAKMILDQRKIWIEETLASNKWVSFRDWLSRVPILWRFGKGAWRYYEEHYPERLRDLQDAVGILIGSPLVRTVWSELHRGTLLSVKPFSIEGESHE
jgi:hypothetical protein